MVVSVENLSKIYGSQKAVDGISFKVDKGEILGFLGPNGAGKTTTMKIITCYLSATSGDVKIDGVSVSDKSEWVRSKIGYLPEHNPLYLDMAIMDYLSFSAAIQGVAKNKIATAVKEMVGLCGLNREKHKQIGELSKGYRQRVGLAQAMIHNPEILILDEPTTGLDPNQIVQIRNLIKDLGQQKTVIFSTHNLPEVEATCNRAMIINQGKIVIDGTPESIRKRAQGNELLKVTIAEASNYNAVFTELQQIPTIALVNPLDLNSGRFQIQSKEDASSKKELFMYCVQKGYVLTELTTVETSFEDIFTNLTVN